MTSYVVCYKLNIYFPLPPQSHIQVSLKQNCPNLCDFIHFSKTSPGLEIAIFLNFTTFHERINPGT